MSNPELIPLLLKGELRHELIYDEHLNPGKVTWLVFRKGTMQEENVLNIVIELEEWKKHMGLISRFNKRLKEHLAKDMIKHIDKNGTSI